MMESESKEDRDEVPLRKRLLTDPNPKQSVVTASPESTVSSDSSSDRIAKKTRELPNLSDCHSCAVRINHTNPRERLQPLDSMWRVVLLCKKCIKQVKSSELCLYCFSDVVDETDCFKCRDCQHSVHKDCVAKYGLGLGFSVCVDCWVPDAVANSIGVRKKKNRKKKNESRVSLQENNESNNVVCEEIERKVVAAEKASENALRKAVVANDAVELAKGVLNGVDDAELAFMLHRAINSSSRISNYTCVMSSVTGDDVPIACYSRRGSNKKINSMNSGSLDVPLMHYSRRGKVSLRNSVSLDSPLMYYSRRRFICKLSERIDKDVSVCSAGIANSNRYLLKYNRVGKGISRPSVLDKDSDCDSCMDSSNLNTEDTSDAKDFGNGNGCHEICEEFDKNVDRFLLKYKRSIRCKA